MYLGSKTTMRLMVVPFVIQAIAMIVCIGLSVPHILTSPGCIEARVPVTLVVYWCEHGLRSCITARAHKVMHRSQHRFGRLRVLPLRSHNISVSSSAAGWHGEHRPHVCLGAGWCARVCGHIRFVFLDPVTGSQWFKPWSSRDGDKCHSLHRQFRSERTDNGRVSVSTITFCVPA